MRGRREAIAAVYSDAFAQLGDLVELPVVEEGVRSAWHLYPLRTAGAGRTARDQLIRDLEELGIGTSVHFGPIHLSSYARQRMGFRGGEFPISEDAYLARPVTAVVRGHVRRGRREGHGICHGTGPPLCLASRGCVLNATAPYSPCRLLRPAWMRLFLRPLPPCWKSGHGGRQAARRPNERWI